MPLCALETHIMISRNLKIFVDLMSNHSSIVACRTANQTSFLRLVVGSASFLSATAIFWRLAIALANPMVHVPFYGNEPSYE